jgi:hypothetical protein
VIGDTAAPGVAQKIELCVAGPEPPFIAERFHLQAAKAIVASL